MIRGEFLRVGFLAPLAALLGCKRKAPTIHMETSATVTESPIQATAWTISTTGTAGTTFYVQGSDGTWVPMNYSTYTVR